MFLYKHHLYRVKGLARSILLAVVLIVSSFGSAFSQGEYLERGQDGSGFGMGFGYSRPANVAAIEGSVGYSRKGIFDLGISVSQLSFNTNRAPGFSFNPHATLHIKPDTIPVFGSVTAGYEWASGVSQGSFLTLGASISWNIRPTSMLYFQPTFGLTFLNGKVEAGGYSLDSESRASLAGLSIVLRTTSKNSLVIEPALGWEKDQKSYSVFIAYILGK